MATSFMIMKFLALSMKFRYDMNIIKISKKRETYRSDSPIKREITEKLNRTPPAASLKDNSTCPKFTKYFSRCSILHCSDILPIDIASSDINWLSSSACNSISLSASFVLTFEIAWLWLSNMISVLNFQFVAWFTKTILTFFLSLIINWTASSWLLVDFLYWLPFQPFYQHSSHRLQGKSSHSQMNSSTWLPHDW